RTWQPQRCPPAGGRRSGRSWGRRWPGGPPAAGPATRPGRPVPPAPSPRAVGGHRHKQSTPVPATAGPCSQETPVRSQESGRGGRLASLPSMEPQPSAPPVVAVVVANEPGDWFEEALVALGGQDYPNQSVLVMDAGAAA